MNIFNKKIFYVSIAVVVVLAVAIAVFQQFFEDNTGQHSPIPPGAIPPPKSSVGETTIDELRARSDLLSEEQIDEDTVRFEFESGVHLHPDTTFTKDGVVQYEASTIHPDDYTTSSYPHIIDYLAEYGTPPLIIQGTWRYGPFARTYVYPELGFSIVGNPATDEVLEIEYFVPMSAEEYTETYGENIRQVDTEHHEEEHI